METKKKHILRNILICFLIILIAGGIGLGVFLNKLDVKYEELPEEPVIGRWYRVSPEGARSSDGSEWHGLFRKGSENKVFIFFYGGGVSFNEETSWNKPDRFYTPDMSLQVAFAGMGITTMDEQNPFKDWTFLAIEYSSGDFHSGQNELTLTKDGRTKTVYHYGYNNYTGFMKMVMACLIFGLFNWIFVGGFFKTAYKFGRPFVIFIVAAFLTIFVAEALHHVPGLEVLNAFGTDNIVMPLILLTAGVILYLLIIVLSYRRACIYFERIDL